MPLLCLDIGNTSAHWGLVDGRSVVASGDIPTASLLADNRALAELLAHPGITGTAMASVVPAVTRAAERG
jgi:pantothenate kinase type III